uniref:DUF2345 domain-containing protein n=1 Tax=uncultured Salinicola sp. TaxID=1193542 RepID=UPI00261A2894
STEDKIDFAAAEEILLVSVGAYVRIKGGDIELHAPGKVTVKGATKSFGGPASLNASMPELPEGEDVLCASKSQAAASSGDGSVES